VVDPGPARIEAAPDVDRPAAVEAVDHR